MIEDKFLKLLNYVAFWRKDGAAAAANGEDDDRPPGLHLGDLGTIFLAGVFLLGMLYMIFAPSPFDGVFDKKPAAQQPGVVDVSVQPRE
jgi:hypothetical protein